MGKRSELVGGLSIREREVLQQFANGYRAEMVAHNLGIKTITARHHIQRIREKVNAPNVTAAVAFAIRQGIIE